MRLKNLSVGSWYLIKVNWTEPLNQTFQNLSKQTIKTFSDMTQPKDENNA